MMNVNRENFLRKTKIFAKTKNIHERGMASPAAATTTTRTASKSPGGSLRNVARFTTPPPFMTQSSNEEIDDAPPDQAQQASSGQETRYVQLNFHMVYATLLGETIHVTVFRSGASFLLHKS
jgi:hypothetical protein